MSLANEKLKKYIATYLVISGIYINYIVEGINKWLLFNAAEITRIAIIFKILYLIFLLGFMLGFPSRNRLVLITIYLFLTVTSTIGFHILLEVNDLEYSYLEHVIYINKYFFAFFVFYTIYDIKNDPLLDKCINALKHLIIFNSLIILVGWILQIPLFSTVITGYTYRFGYSGLIPAGNEASLFLIIGIVLFYDLYLKRKISFWTLALVVFSSLFSGVKAIYVFLFLLFLYHFISHFRIKILLLLILAILLVSFYDPLIPYIEDKLKYFINYYEREGVVNMIFSGRNKQIQHEFLLLIRSEWTLPNFMLGGMITKRHLVEMDFLDLFSHFGIIGSFIYLLVLYETYFRKLKSFFSCYFVGIVFCLSFVAGHLLTTSTNAYIFPLLILYLQNQKIGPIDNKQV